MTGQGEIAQDRWATMLLRDDVLDLKGHRRGTCLWEQTVLTAQAGAAPDSFAQRSIH